MIKISQREKATVDQILRSEDGNKSIHSQVSRRVI